MGPHIHHFKNTPAPPNSIQTCQSARLKAKLSGQRKVLKLIIYCKIDSHAVSRRVQHIRWYAVLEILSMCCLLEMCRHVQRPCEVYGLYEKQKHTAAHSLMIKLM